MPTPTSFAARVIYGRPLAPGDDSTIQVAARPSTALAGRALISTIFFITGIGKLLAPATTTAYVASLGLPAPYALSIIAGIIEVAGATALLLGLFARLGALGLFLYLIPVTLIAHAFWRADAASAQLQQVQFLKNLAIMGGLLLLYAFGPSAFSLDHKIREPIQP